MSNFNLGFLYRSIVNRDGKATTIPHRPKDQKISDCRWDSNSGGDSIGTLPSFCLFNTIFIGFHNWRTAFRLHSYHTRSVRSYPTDAFQFFECLPHPN
jgi:hypothetical protein